MSNDDTAVPEALAWNVHVAPVEDNAHVANLTDQISEMLGKKSD